MDEFGGYEEGGLDVGIAYDELVEGDILGGEEIIDPEVKLMKIWEEVEGR